MSLEFNEDNLIDLCELVTDGSHHSPPSQVEGYYMASVKDMGTYKFNYSDCRKISEEDYNKLVKSGCSPKNDDILIAKDGSPLSNIFIYKEEYPIVLLSSIAIIRPNKSKILPEFLKYYLENHSIKRYIQTTYTSGSVIPRIILKDFKKFPIIYPNLENQKKIIGILRTIDKKIAINEEINRNLLQLSKVIFKNWFVEFEPFGGVQPDDWKICALEDVCDLNAGGDKPEVVSDEITDSCIYPIYSNGLDNDGLYGYTNHAKIFEECVTVSARGTIGFVCLRHTPYVPIVRLVSVIPKKKFISAKYLYLFLDRLNIMGTGTTQQQLTIPDFKKTEILVPTLDVIKSFTNHLNPLFEKIWMQEEEMKKLSKLRDTLLPKLMSGEIDVSKINCDSN